MDEEQIPAEQPVNVQLIYCGPTLPPKWGLRQYQVFIGGLPERIKEFAKECPAINSLFVPVVNFAEIRIALGQKGSVEASQYLTVINHLGKE